MLLRILRTITPARRRTLLLSGVAPRWRLFLAATCSAACAIAAFSAAAQATTLPSYGSYSYVSSVLAKYGLSLPSSHPAGTSTPDTTQASTLPSYGSSAYVSSVLAKYGLSVPSSDQAGTSSPSPSTPQASTLPGKLTSDAYTSGSGTLKYELYVPSSYKAGSSMPLVVALHGCTQTADVYRQQSGWDALAEAKGFIVVFPEQSTSRNRQACWNWFQQADMHRGSGEPAMIADLTTSIVQSHSVDSHRVYVAGFSAGAAMATVMGAAYPDLYAAIGSGSGCEYNGLPCLSYQGPDPTQTGKQAYDAMGNHARVMPAIVFQGDADSIVGPANAPQIVREWQITDDYADDGSLNGSIPTTPTGVSNGTSPGGRSYTVTSYGDGHGKALIEYWLVHGMNHAWSGGSASQQYSDPSGPNETAAMYAFFSSHPAP
jgi:poly(hydroxyalkanoate) depolymerase family esterase